jgi:hypothetical protein
LLNCGKLAPRGKIGAVAQSGERRLCTAEVRGSNPLGSTLKICWFAGKIELEDQLIETANTVLVQQRRGEGEKAVINEVYQRISVWLTRIA